MQDTQRRRLTYAALAGLLLGLGGCGADTIDVTRVSRLSTGATNERFTMRNTGATRWRSPNRYKHMVLCRWMIPVARATPWF
jgi:hypothetical protein